VGELHDGGKQGSRFGHIPAHLAWQCSARQAAAADHGKRNCLLGQAAGNRKNERVAGLFYDHVRRQNVALPAPANPSDHYSNYDYDAIIFKWRRELFKTVPVDGYDDLRESSLSSLKIASMSFMMSNRPTMFGISTVANATLA